jgi:hypothetical protein
MLGNNQIPDIFEEFEMELQSRRKQKGRPTVKFQASSSLSQRLPFSLSEARPKSMSESSSSSASNIKPTFGSFFGANQKSSLLSSLLELLSSLTGVNPTIRILSSQVFSIMFLFCFHFYQSPIMKPRLLLAV